MTAARNPYTSSSSNRRPATGRSRQPAIGRSQRPANGRLQDEAGQEKGEEGAAEGEASRCTNSIRGDGALFDTGIAAGLSHFLPSQTRGAGDEAILRGAAAQHCQTPNDPEREEPGSPSDARRTQQQPNSSSSGSGAHT